MSFLGQHPLTGLMDKRSPWQIRQALALRPPTREQLDALAAEELATRDRPEVWRLFAEFSPPKQ